MKPSKIFTAQEIQAIGKALQTALGENPVLPHWEFPTLSGVSMEEALGVLEAWPDVDIDSDMEWRALWGVFLHLRSYPHKQTERVFRETGLRKEDFRSLMDTMRPIEPK